MTINNPGVSSSGTKGVQTTTDEIKVTFSALTKTIPLNTAQVYRSYVAAKDQSNTFSNVYVRTVRVHRFGGGAIIGLIEDDNTSEDDTSLDCTFEVSVNDLLVKITGKASTNIDWVGRIVEISTGT